MINKEELLGLENPYELLSDGDTLVEHARLLDALSAEEKHTLAAKIIEACPGSSFKQYGYQLKALRSSFSAEGTFYSVIAEAYKVRQIIFALLDPINKYPQRLFLEEFNPALFHRFSDLASQLLKNIEPLIAERLALCTPEEQRSDVVRNTTIAFPRAILASKVQSAFTLRRNVERLLLGDNPEQFFISPDFNKDECTQFTTLLAVLLTDRTQQIGAKLAVLESDELRANIKRQLSLMHTEVFDKENPFRFIAEVMGEQEKDLQKKEVEQATNIYTLFNAPTNKKLPDQKERNEAEENFSFTQASRPV